LFKDPKAGQLVLDVVKGEEDCISVAGDLGLVGVASLIGESVALTCIEDQLRSLRTQGPQRARSLDPRTDMNAFKAALRSQADGGIKCGYGNPNLRVGRCGAALSGGNVRATLQQLRRHTNGNLWQRQALAVNKRRWCNAEI